MLNLRNAFKKVEHLEARTRKQRIEDQTIKAKIVRWWTKKQWVLTKLGSSLFPVGNKDPKF